jgi:hypothetical protein
VITLGQALGRKERITVSFKKVHLGIFLLIISTVCIMLKLLISYIFPLSRLLLIVLVPIAIVCLIIFFIANRHLLKIKQVLIRILVSVAALTFTLLPIDSQLELARFYVSKGVYESAVQDVTKDIPTSERIETGQLHLQFPYNIVAPYYGWVNYYKVGDSVAILFPASESLSIVRYYAYFSDNTAKDLLVHPHKYGQADNVRGVDRIDALDGSHWGYVLTWGTGEMVPKDPYL